MSDTALWGSCCGQRKLKIGEQADSRKSSDTGTDNQRGEFRMGYQSQNIRNIALMGHSGAGKSTLAETMIYESGNLSKRGRSEERRVGNSVEVGGRGVLKGREAAEEVWIEVR